MEYQLEDLIDIPLLQDLQDKLNGIYSFPSAIIDKEGKILTAVAWQDVCTKFHRMHPQCEKECIISDQYIQDHIQEANPAVCYQCPHGLVDNAAPIIIDGKHLGNFFTGQFFLEKPDFEFFKKQAKKYGFDEKAYMEAVEKVPIWSKEKLDKYIDFIRGFIEIIAGIGLKHLKEIEANKALKESEEKFSKVFHLNPSACDLTDLNTGKYLEVNEAFYTLFGFDKNEVIGKTPSELGILTPEAINAILLKANSNGNTTNVEASLKTKHGDIKHVLLSSENIYLSDKQYLFTVVHDITEHKLAEQQQRESQQIIEGIINAIPASIFWKDENLKYMGCNQAFANDAGFSDPKEIVGKDDFQMIWRNQAEMYRNDDLQVIKSATSKKNIEEHQTSPDGKISTILTSKSPLKNSKGQVAGVIGTYMDITKRKQAESILYDIIDKNPMSIQIVDTEGFTLKVNPSHTALFGAVPPPGFSIFNDLQSRSSELGRLIMLAKSGKVVHFPDLYYNVHDISPEFPDKPLWIHAILFPLEDSTGKFDKFVLMHENITWRKQAEEAIKVNEQKFRNILESSPFQIWAFDGEIYNYVNKSYIDFTGIDTSKTLTPETWTNYVHPDDLEAAGKIWMDALKNKAEHENYFRLRNKLGQYRDFWCHAVPIYDENGNFKQFQGFNIDITERKQSEENLRLHSGIVENMAEGVLLTRTSDGVIVYANPAIEKMLKAAPGILTGKHISTINVATDRSPDEIANEIIQALKTSGTWHGEIKNLRLDGSAAWCYANVSTFYHPQHGNVWVAIHQDISERKFAEAKLKESEMRAHRQREALAVLAIDESLLSTDLNEGFNNISKILSSTIEVEMASVWLLSEDKKTLHCHSLFEASSKKQSSGATLVTANIPTYFAAIQKESRIYASDVQNDPRTIELRDNYLIPNEITSMLDAGILIKGKLAGVVCLEHKGPKRQWESDEEAFASTVSSIVAQALINSERLKTKELLIESEQKFREIYNSTNESILINDALTGQMIDCNQRAVEMYGYADKEEILRGNIIALGSNAEPFTDEKVLYNIRKTIEEGNHTFEWLAKKKNGNLFPVEVSLRIAEIGGGKRILSVIRDITERKLAEEKIHEKDIQFRKLSAQMPDLIFQFTRRPDGSYYVPIASEGIRNIFGCSPEDVLNDFAPISKVIYPEDATRVIADIEYSAEHLTYFTCEFRVQIPGKEIQWILSRSTPEMLPDGSITWYGFNADITDRKQAEEELKHLSARLSLAVRTGGVGVWDYDIINNILYWDNQMFALYGISKNDFGGVFEAWRSGLHPEDMVRSDAEIQMAISGVKEFDTEFRIVWPDGSIHNIRALATIHRSDNGQVEHMIGTNWDITDQKKVEQELIFAKEKAEESEEKYKLLHENAGIGIGYFSPEALVISFNQIAAKHMNGNPEDFIGKSIFDLFPKPAADFYFNRFQKAVLSTEPKVYEDFIQLPNDEKWFLSTYTKIADSQGKVFGIQVISQDITKIKKAEIELLKAKEKAEENEQKYRMLFDSNKDSISLLSIGTDGKPSDFIEFNHAACGMFGFTREELMLKKLGELETPVPENIMIQRLEALKAKGSVDFETIITDKSGNEIDVEVKVIPINYQNQPALMNITRDISERKKAEQQLITAKEHAENNNRINEARLKLLKFSENHTIDEILEETLNTAEIISHSKIGFFHFVEQDQNNLLLQNWSTGTKKYFCNAQGKGLHYPIDKAGVWVDCLSERKPVIHNNYEALIHKKGLPEGHAKLIRELVIPIIYDDIVKAICGIGNKETEYDQIDVENISLLAYLAWEIVEKKKISEALVFAKEKAEESDRLKSAFLANMSHEIRTPMNGILGFAELLKDPELSGEQQQTFIEVIEKSGNRMLNIINDIVSISKIESGTMDIHLKETNINNQMQFVYDILKLDADKKKLNLSYKCLTSDKEAIIKTDSEKFLGILSNLVKNAIKYTNSGSIEYGYTNKGQEFEFYVKDTGIGIPKDRQEAIFERFIQADIADKMAHQGAGLGLAISSAYVAMLGGKIWVDSEEGKGSVFYFTLPYNIEPPAETIVLQSAPSEKSDAVRKLKILIAEDDEVSVMLFDNHIKMYSKVLLKAGSGVEAVEACRDNLDIDLILMDIRMPGMDGYEATKQIREFNKKVIIIAQTAYGLSGDREKSIESGCNDYISKPINKSELLALIQKYFGK